MAGTAHAPIYHATAQARSTAMDDPPSAEWSPAFRCRAALPYDLPRQASQVPMLSVLAIAVVLVATTVAVHAYGLSFLVPMLGQARATPPRGHWPITSLLVRIALVLIALHLIEITIWALFFWCEGCLSDAESAFYFSGVTYTTLGYGDVVLIKPWRMLGPIEALTGVLMCALSAGVFFATISRIYQGQMESGA